MLWKERVEEREGEAGTHFDVNLRNVADYVAVVVEDR